MTLIIVIGFLLMIIGGFYLSIKYGHRLRRIKARRNCQICLVLDGSELKDIHLHCIILVFDRLGHLVRKFPEAEMRQMKGQCMLYCTVNFEFLCTVGPSCPQFEWNSMPRGY